MRLVKRDRTRKGDVLPHWKSQAICTVILSLTPSSVFLPTYKIIELRLIRLVEHAKQTVYHPAFDLKLRMARFEYINGDERDAEAEQHEDKHDRHQHGPPGGVVAYDRVCSVGEQGIASSERMMRVFTTRESIVGMCRK
jgi:hypothetical protein